MEGGDVELRRGHQHDEATHQSLGAQHQHRPSLGGVLVASVLPSRQPRLGNWPSRTIPGESLHALSVVGVDPASRLETSIREGTAILPNGHSPTGAQTGSVTGFKPMRCTSVAKTSMGLPGCFGASSARVSAFLNAGAFFGCRRFRILQARRLDQSDDRLQGFPAALRRNRRQAEFPGHPAHSLAARPQTAAARRLANRMAPFSAWIPWPRTPSMQPPPRSASPP